MKDRFNLDLSVLGEIPEDIDRFQASEPFLDHYEEELARREFSWEYCLEVLRSLTRWYDIVRLARRTRRAFQRVERHYRSLGQRCPFPAPDTLAMLEQADRRDPGGNPVRLASLVRHLATLLARCREVIVELMEENARLKSAARADREDYAPRDDRERNLALSVPSGRLRREAIGMMERMSDTEQFVRMVQWLVNERVVSRADASSASFVRPFVPYLPEAKRLSRRVDTLCLALTRGLMDPQ